MRLINFEYAEHVGNSQEWTLSGLVLGSKNLLVGRNSTGKSRSLNVISGLSRILNGLPLPKNGTYSCVFLNKDDKYEYVLQIQEGQVLKEVVTINGVSVLDRTIGGVGIIYAQALGDKGENIAFQAPPNVSAVTARQDAIQHPFLEPLTNWAKSVRHYYFGSALGKEDFAVFTSGAIPVDDRNQNQVVGIFYHGQREFGDRFTKSLIDDLLAVDYHVEEVGLSAPVSVSFDNVPGLVGLYVKEKNLSGITDQISMSQGMFRVLSLLIQVNYFQLKQTASCVLIDDIGEGLDFDRSCRLISLLREKADNSNVQMVMSTNDRFIMNNVPLEEWSMLVRKENHVTVKNYENSKISLKSLNSQG